MCPGHSILAAPATAELEPLADGQVSQTDEVMLVASSPRFSLSPCSYLSALAFSSRPFCSWELRSIAGVPAGEPRAQRQSTAGL